MNNIADDLHSAYLEGHQDGMKVARPIPDPVTGLVPCGCGGKAVLRNVNIVETGNHCVSCGQCGVRTEWLSKDKAIKVWNAARGYREES